MADVVFVIVVLLRFGLPLLIPRYPLPAIVACLVIDAADQTIFQAFTDDPLTGYQTYDKALDVYYLAIAYIASMRNWRDPAAFDVARFLYLYRLVGVTLFELLDQRWLLLVFPNTFEYFFIAYEAVRTRWDPGRLSARMVVTIAAVIWIVVKLPQEWWIHVARLDFTDVMGDRPLLWIALGAAAVVVVAFGRAARSRLPSADWPLSFDIDRHLAVLDTVTSTPYEPFFTAVLIEKTVLLALLGVIFAQVLPDVRSTDLELAFGVVVLVVLNAAISQALRRRGRSWTSSARQFVAMMTINIGIVMADTLSNRRGDDRTPALDTVFFMVLLSLMIALFDRYRATRAKIDMGPGVISILRSQRGRGRATLSRASVIPPGRGPSSAR